MDTQCWNLVYIVGASAFVSGLVLAEIIFWSTKKYVKRYAPVEDKLRVLHQPPSWVVKAYETYLTWCGVTVCKKCGLHAHEIDFWPPGRCPQCGSKSTWFRKTAYSNIGYWSMSERKWVLNKSMSGGSDDT